MSGEEDPFEAAPTDEEKKVESEDPFAAGDDIPEPKVEEPKEDDPFAAGDDDVAAAAPPAEEKAAEAPVEEKPVEAKAEQEDDYADEGFEEDASPAEEVKEEAAKATEPKKEEAAPAKAPEAEPVKEETPVQEAKATSSSAKETAPADMPPISKEDADLFDEEKDISPPKKRFQSGKKGTRPNPLSRSEILSSLSVMSTDTAGKRKKNPYDWDAPFLNSLSKVRRGPKWSMGSKLEFGSTMYTGRRANRGAEPGTYEINEKTLIGKHKSAPYFSFGANERWRRKRALGKSPAPGEYTPYDPSIAPGASVGFGKSKRMPTEGLDEMRKPGPGTYNVRSTVGQGPRFTALSRDILKGTKKGSATPGPGAYTIPSSLQSGVKCGFGSAGRDQETRRIEQESMGRPGPGSYNVKNTMGDVGRVTITGRFDANTYIESYLSPGPGSYDAHATSFGY